MLTSFEDRFNFKWPLTLGNDLTNSAYTKTNDLKNNGKVKRALAWDSRCFAFSAITSYVALRKSLNL